MVLLVELKMKKVISFLFKGLLLFGVILFLLGIGLYVGIQAPFWFSDEGTTDAEANVLQDNCKRREINRDNILVLVNEYRLEKGLEMFYGSDSLDKYAQARAEENAENEESTHNTNIGNYWDWAKNNRQIPENYTSVSELVVVDGVSACHAIDKFKSSPTHNAGLIDPKASTIGIGVASKEPGWASHIVLELGND